MKQINGTWYNKKAGGLGLGLLIIIAYISIKVIKLGFTLNLFWTSLWFMGLVLAALLTDLFENIDSWVQQSFKIVENQNLSKEQKIESIKNQLEIAQDRYLEVFLMLNYDTLIKSLITRIGKIVKGLITVKELIILVAYALYDLVIREGMLSFLYPYDVAVIFGVLVLLSTLNAKAGIASLIVAMYKEAKDIKNVDTSLDKIVSYIKQLCNVLHIEILS